jgi:hypothetical protein
MAKALYNPKYLTVNGVKTLNTADVKRFVWDKATWQLNAGEIKKFPDSVGQAMLRHLEFLVEVTPENLKKIQGEISEKKFKCQDCEFGTDTKIAFLNHVKTHKKNVEEEKILDGIQEAAPTDRFEVKRQPLRRRPTPEQSEGIPQAGKDADGVEFYGGGLEKDTIN